MRATTETMRTGCLPNGLKFVLVPLSPHKDGDGLVSVATVYNVGSEDELGTQEGVAHLFEHLNHDEQLFLQAHGRGMEINASTGFDR